MTEKKITLSWDELRNPAIDKRIEEDRKTEEQRKGLAAPLALGDEQGSRKALLNAMFYLAIAGLCFGFLAWGVSEVYSLTEDEETRVQFVDKQWRELVRDGYSAEEAERIMISRISRWKRADSAVWFGLVGLILGFGLAAAEGTVMRTSKKAVIEGLIGMAVGFLGGLVAGYVGQAVYSAMLSDHTRGVTQSFTSPARIVGWAIAGGFLGVAQGAGRLLPKKSLYGLIGGLLGGALGGFLFDPVARSVGAGWISRLVGICVVGGAVGFFVGLVEALAKDAWIRVAAGRLSGKQFIAYRNPTVIGADMSCDVYLFRDEDVAPQHAAIWRVAGGFEIEDLNSPMGTIVNNQPVRRTKLRAGDQIRLGSNLLVFEEKERRRVH